MKISELRDQIKRYEELCAIAEELKLFHHFYDCYGSPFEHKLNIINALGGVTSLSGNAHKLIHDDVKECLRRALCRVQEEIDSLDINLVTED